MIDRALYETSLGVEAPWAVTGVEPDLGSRTAGTARSESTSLAPQRT
jgi:hypothetical protein